MLHMGAPKKSGALGCSLVSQMVNPALIIDTIYILKTYYFNKNFHFKNYCFTANFKGGG